MNKEILGKDGAIFLSNVFELNQSDGSSFFMTKIKLKDIAKVFKRLRYNHNAQRGVDKNHNPLINDKHKKSIKEAILKKESISGFLTWNIRISNKIISDTFYDYDEKNLNLIISNKADIYIPDSAHRHNAIFELVRDIDYLDEDILECDFPLFIYNGDELFEKTFFSNINGKILKPNNNRVIYLNTDIRSDILKEAVTKSDLSGKLETVKNSANTTNTFANFSTVYDSLFSSLGIWKNKKITFENKDIYINYLIEFFNSLISSRKEFNSKDLISEKKKTKKDSMVLEGLSWWGYMMILNYLVENNISMLDYKRYINTIMNSKDINGKIDWLSKSGIPDIECIRKNTIDKNGKAILSNSVMNSNTTRAVFKKYVMKQCINVFSLLEFEN